MTATTSSGSSDTVISENSAGPMLALAITVSLSQESRPDQYSLPTSTIGNLVILPVATRVSASNSSSIVPKPPGRTTNACEYLTKQVFLTKKYRNSRPTST